MPPPTRDNIQALLDQQNLAQMSPADRFRATLAARQQAAQQALADTQGGMGAGELSSLLEAPQAAQEAVRQEQMAGAVADVGGDGIIPDPDAPANRIPGPSARVQEQAQATLDMPRGGPEVRAPDALIPEEGEPDTVASVAAEGVPGSADVPTAIDQPTPGPSRIVGIPGGGAGVRMSDGNVHVLTNLDVGHLRALGLSNDEIAEVTMLALGEEGGRGRPGRPPTTVTTETSFSQEGFVDPELRAGLAGANDAVRQAQAGVDAQQRAMAQQAADNQAALAAEQAAANRRAEEAERRRQQQLQDRVARVDQVLERVRNQQVDPEQFFGGFGGRMGAAIAVALGQLGSQLTGGPNTALQIINQAIERNMTAQQANMQNQRQAAAMEQSALGQFRAILGDDRAAESAARVAHLDAVISRLNASMANMQPEALQRAQTLRDALMEQRQLAAQVAAQAADGAVSVSIRREDRSNLDPAQVADGRNRLRQAFAQRRQLQRSAESVMREMEANPADMVVSQADVEAAEAAANIAPEFGTAEDGSITVERGVGDDPILRQREADLAVVERAQGERGSQARAAIRARARRQANQVVPATLDAQEVNRRLTMLSNARDLGDERSLPFELGPYLNVSDPARTAQIWRVNGEQFHNDVREAVTAFNTATNFLNEIERLRREGSALAPGERRSRLQALSTGMQRILQVADNYGVINSPGELERLEETAPDASDWRLSGAWVDSIMSDYRALRERLNTQLAARLAPAGIRLNTARERSR